MVNKPCCISSEKLFPGHPNTSRGLAGGPQNVPPARALQMHFLPEGAGSSRCSALLKIWPQSTHDTSVFRAITSLYYPYNSVRGWGRGRVFTTLIACVSSPISCSQCCIYRLLTTTLDSARGYMPTLYSCAMVKTSNAHLPRASLAGRLKRPPSWSRFTQLLLIKSPSRAH